LFAGHLFADNYSQDLFSQAKISAASVVRQTVMRTDNYLLTSQYQLVETYIETVSSNGTNNMIPEYEDIISSVYRCSLIECRI